MRLPVIWDEFLKDTLQPDKFYRDLDNFLAQFKTVLPQKDKIFNVFNFRTPGEVKCVLFGEDPYPRITSACGVAFWDKEINSWEDKTNGNSLKNMLKALLIARGKAKYSTKIAEVREIAHQLDFKTPPQLFEHWLDQGILLINTSLTFTTAADKNRHFEFWHPFHKTLIRALNNRDHSPFYILWGNKAQRWEKEILESIDMEGKIIKQGHPTFIHQFLDKNRPDFSPFTEIIEKTGLSWY